MAPRSILLIVLAVALFALPAGASARKAPSPQTQVKRAFKQLVKDTRVLPKTVVTKRVRVRLQRVVKTARRQARHRPCKAIKTLGRFRRATRKVHDRKKRGATITSFRPRLRADLVEANSALMQLPRAKRCGGGRRSKVDTLQSKVIRSDAKSLRMRVSLPPPTFVAQQGGGQDFQQMYMDGMGESDVNGKPGLPMSSEFFGIPVGANVQLHVNGTQGYDLHGVNLFPHQEPPVDAAAPPGAPPLTDFLEGPFQIDRKVYRSGKRVPRKPASAGDLGKLRDLRIGGVDLTGAQYKPKTDTLHVFTSVDVTVKFGGGNSGKFGKAPDFKGPWNARFAHDYGALVKNEAAVENNLDDL